MDLSVFLEPKIDLPRVTHILDGLGPMGRVATVRGWEREQMKKLYEAAKGYHPLTLEHFVPASVGARTEVIHEGKNSLGAFTHFQKRFARSTAHGEEGAVVFGYNEQEMALWTGPGYFVVHDAKTAGEIDIDYRELPADTVEGWPEVASNTARLGRFVYDGMVDVMRGISSHVSIGRARKKDGWMDAWFLLCRIDPD